MNTEEIFQLQHSTWPHCLTHWSFINVLHYTVHLGLFALVKNRFLLTPARRILKGYFHPLLWILKGKFHAQKFKGWIWGYSAWICISQNGVFQEPWCTSKCLTCLWCKMWDLQTGMKDRLTRVSKCGWKRTSGRQSIKVCMKQWVIKAAVKWDTEWH